MADLMIVGLSGVRFTENLKLPSVTKSKRKRENISHIPIRYKNEIPEKKNISFVIEHDKSRESICLRSKLDALKNNDSPVDNSYSSSAIKTIIARDHLRKAKPVQNSIVIYEGEKKSKPLKLLDKINSDTSLSQEIFVNWAELIKASNGIETIPLLSGKYKYYIGKGNNASLIGHLLKSRFWWIRAESPEMANLVWTQFNHKKTLNNIKYTDKIENALLKSSAKPSEAYLQRETALGITEITESSYFAKKEASLVIQSEDLKVHNRLVNNLCICNKKNLYGLLSEFYTKHESSLRRSFPLAFFLEHGLQDENFQSFLKVFKENSVWIIKPESSNQEISIANNLQDIKEAIRGISSGKPLKIQKYIENPLLINRRKFDIKCFVLVTCVNGILQAYFYKEGYLRTSSKEFILKQLHDQFIHFTSDEIQRNSEDYGKNETGNKLSYSDFQKFLEVCHPDKSFQFDIYNPIEKIVKDCIFCVKDLLHDSGKSVTFQILEFGFIVDNNFNVWLIEVNDKPCLEFGNSYLAKIIPEMLENTFKIALDPNFSPNIEHKRFKTWVQEKVFQNKFTLIYSSSVKLPDIN